MIASHLIVVVAMAAKVGIDARVDAVRTVERTRYAFRVGTTVPFDTVYPRSRFGTLVARQIDEETILQQVFGVVVTPDVLRAELQRVEASTRAPDQWAAIKAALGEDTVLIKEAVCRPLVVSRTIRARFAFDKEIHSGPHREARRARAQLRAGPLPPTTKRLQLQAGGGIMTTDRWLEQAKARHGALPDRVPAASEAGEPMPLPADLANVLDRELHQPGDVTTVLEWPDRFEVFRLVGREGSIWTVEAVHVPKRDFEEWLNEQRAALDGGQATGLSPMER